jgi:hypothetical protein
VGHGDRDDRRVVVVIFGVFKGKITSAISDAIDSVTGATGS